MTRTAYGVATGEYSDYRVLCVCEDRATAERLVKAYNGDDEDAYSVARVESFDMFEEGFAPKRVWFYHAEVTLRDDFTTSEPRYHSHVEWNFEGRPPSRPKVDYVRAPILNNKAGYLRVLGPTERSVAKVIGERVAAFKARSWVPQGERAINVADERF